MTRILAALLVVALVVFAWVWVGLQSIRAF